MTYQVPVVRVSVFRERTIELSTPYAVHELAAQVCGEDDSNETMAVIALDGRNHCCGIKVVAQGGKSSLCVTAREILVAALEMHAHAFVLAHNHPSGSEEPSQADDIMTGEVMKSADVIGIAMVDHVVVTWPGGPYYSYRENGRIE